MALLCTYFLFFFVPFKEWFPVCKVTLFFFCSQAQSCKKTKTVSKNANPHYNANLHYPRVSYDVFLNTSIHIAILGILSKKDLRRQPVTDPITFYRVVHKFSDTWNELFVVNWFISKNFWGNTKWKKVSSPHYFKILMKLSNHGIRYSLKRDPRSISKITFYANLSVSPISMEL